MKKKCSMVMFLLLLVMLSQGFFVNADTPHTIFLGTNDDHSRPTINGNISVGGTQCTDTEKRHFRHCEASKLNHIGADWSDRICDALDFIVKECFPILKSCLVESTIDNEVESYLRGYVAAQKDHASKLKIKQCAIVQEYLGSDECTQSMLNQKYGEWFQCNLKTFKSLEQQLLILKKTNAGVHPIIRNRSRMYSTRARPGTNLPLRSNIQKEFCNALRSLTVGMCGKIAERCEPNATLETFRYTHRVNVGEALNKFIFGNVKLFDNNFIKVEQCNQVDVWEEEIDGSGAKFGYMNQKDRANIEKRIIPGIIQPPFPEFGRSRDSKIYRNQLRRQKNISQASNRYNFNRLLHKRRQMMTTNFINNTKSICNNIVMRRADTYNDPILCIREINSQRGSKNQNLQIKNDDAKFSSTNKTENNDIQSLNYPMYKIMIGDKSQLISFKNISAHLVASLGKPNSSINRYLSILPSSSTNHDYITISNNNTDLPIDNNVTSITKFGDQSFLDTDSREEDTWILDDQSSATEKPLSVDLPFQQPLKSRGITLGMNPFLQFGEIGIIMYPVLYRTF